MDTGKPFACIIAWLYLISIILFDWIPIYQGFQLEKNYREQPITIRQDAVSITNNTFTGFMNIGQLITSIAISTATLRSDLIKDDK